MMVGTPSAASRRETSWQTASSPASEPPVSGHGVDSLVGGAAGLLGCWAVLGLPGACSALAAAAISKRRRPKLTHASISTVSLRLSIRLSAPVSILGLEGQPSRLSKASDQRGAPGAAWNFTGEFCATPRGGRACVRTVTR